MAPLQSDGATNAKSVVKIWQERFVSGTAIPSRLVSTSLLPCSMRGSADIAESAQMFASESQETMDRIMRLNHVTTSLHHVLSSSLVMGVMLIIAAATSPILAQDGVQASVATEITDTKFFTTSGRCAQCHSSSPNAKALRDAQGRSVAPADLWPTTMMANSSVDPLWRAVVASEVALTPSRKKEIEAKCLRCHAPMASVEAEINGVKPSRALFLDSDSTYAKLAADGVSCTVCHQIPPEGLGDDTSFSGKFEIGRHGKIFGPHARPFAMPMYRHTGYVPTESPHVRKSALCASCHTLFTHALNSDGTATGHTLLEQGPYVEWQNSHYNDEVPSPGEHAASCQDCHMPTADLDGNPIKTRIARNPHGFDFPPLRPREPFGRHGFLGANTLMLSILRDSVGAADSTQQVAKFNTSIEQSRKFLQEKTASITISNATLKDRQLEIDVLVTNFAGHKLPTAYPSRRVWIRLCVEDANGETVFVSGDYDDRGRIVDDQKQLLPFEQAGGPQSAHQTEIRKSTQVQIYESVMADSHGETSYSLLRAAQYQKDNRLLPAGWRSDHKRGQVTSPAGTNDDDNFMAGSDSVRYVVDTANRLSPFQITASVCYQTLGARYIAELLKSDVAEIEYFRKLYDAADPKPEKLAEAKKIVHSKQ
ncbi:MAG: hypothetical protein KDB27_20210 [Planctomycetales bacterium]|nr:hypothetical protein [Planctomycetales bacterium]